MKIIMIALSLLLTSVVCTADSIAIIKNVKGTVTLKRNDIYLPAQKGDWLEIKDVVQTADNSSIGFAFDDGTVISVGPKSIFVVDTYLFKPSSKEYGLDLSLNKGTAAFESGKISKLAPQKVQFRVPQGVIGIRGTKFVVEVE